ncbi:hypothetical protein OG905_00800 [Streptomyces sp. NBC_00322]|uniref:hypothetical protein n=1 Tax=Streptomyces sp. NBC_00322 TaxID=2975712 RepID=UPI002E2D4F23|nr:hypothetical protein [Streptomyces sp. NBC_00322]
MRAAQRCAAPTRQAESSYRQIKTFQRGRQEVLRSASPQVVHQEVWAHLILHHCLSGLIMRLADGDGIDPDRISLVMVLKHARRSVISHCADSPTKIRKFTAMLVAKVRRNLDNGPRRLRGRSVPQTTQLSLLLPAEGPTACAGAPCAHQGRHAAVGGDPVIKQRHCVAGGKGGTP